MLADHSLVTCNFALSRPSSPPQKTRLMRRVSSIDGAAFARAVSETTIRANLEQLADCSVADLCSRYFNDLRHVLDCAASCITVTIAQRPASPWFDGECRACRCRIRAFERRYRRARSPTDLVAWSTALDKKETLLVTKEQTYWACRLQECSGDSRQLWRCLNTSLMREVRRRQVSHR